MHIIKTVNQQQRPASSWFLDPSTCSPCLNRWGGEANGFPLPPALSMCLCGASSSSRPIIFFSYTTLTLASSSSLPNAVYLLFSTHARHVIRCGWRPLPSAPVEEIASEARELLQLVASACDTFFFFTFFLH